MLDGGRINVVEIVLSDIFAEIDLKFLSGNGDCFLLNEVELVFDCLLYYGGRT